MAQNCQHIAHIDHFDKNLLDLIVCLFSEQEHSSDILYFKSSKNTAQSFFKDLAKIKTLAIVAACFHFLEAEPTSIAEDIEQFLTYPIEVSMANLQGVIEIWPIRTATNGNV